MDKKRNEELQLTEKEKLEWIETFEKINEIRKGEGGLREKMAAKIKQNPFVPVGLVATTAALTYGVYAMKSGNKRKSQLMMRTRIIAQGFTIGAIIVGIAIAAKAKAT